MGVLISKEEGLKLLKQKIINDFGSQINYADSQGFTPQYVSKVLTGKSTPPPHMLRMVGMKQVKAFEIEK